MGPIDRDRKVASDPASDKYGNSNSPVAEDFMYDFKYNYPLPTADILGVKVPADCNAQLEADAILANLADAMETGNAQRFTELFLEHGELFFYLQYLLARNLTSSVYGRRLA